MRQKQGWAGLAGRKNKQKEQKNQGKDIRDQPPSYTATQLHSQSRSQKESKIYRRKRKITGTKGGRVNLS